MNVRHPMGILDSFYIKNIFHDKMDLRDFYFHLMICCYYEIICYENNWRK